MQSEFVTTVEIFNYVSEFISGIENSAIPNARTKVHLLTFSLLSLFALELKTEKKCFVETKRNPIRWTQEKFHPKISKKINRSDFRQQRGREVLILLIATTGPAFSSGLAGA